MRADLERVLSIRSSEASASEASAQPDPGCELDPLPWTPPQHWAGPVQGRVRHLVRRLHPGSRGRRAPLDHTLGIGERSCLRSSAPRRRWTASRASRRPALPPHRPRTRRCGRLLLCRRHVDSLSGCSPPLAPLPLEPLQARLRFTCWISHGPRPSHRVRRGDLGHSRGEVHPGPVWAEDESTGQRETTPRRRDRAGSSKPHHCIVFRISALRCPPRQATRRKDAAIRVSSSIACTFVLWGSDMFSSR